MENINTDYAALLHSSPFNPYSQYCVPAAFHQTKDGARANQGTNVFWRISALDDEAVRQIIEPLAAIEAITLRKLAVQAQVVSRDRRELDVKQLVASMLEDDTTQFRLRFHTPTAFKVAGRYQHIPSTQLILQNLLMHYSMVFDGSHEVDPETIEYIKEHTWVSSYNLHTQPFNIAGKKITGFTGTLTLRASGSKPLIGLVGMLCRFAEFSGIGIKTSMGMGGVTCVMK